MLHEPIAQILQIRSERSECSHFLARLLTSANPDAGTDTFLVHIQTGAAAV
jgi:hypothetical protein